MCSVLPELKLDEVAIENIELIGAGGKEKLIKSIFSSQHHSITRVTHALYDFVVDDQLIECKRQNAGNWFDYGKYHNLGEKDRDILMLFINHQ